MLHCLIHLQLVSRLRRFGGLQVRSHGRYRMAHTLAFVFCISVLPVGSTWERIRNGSVSATTFLTLGSVFYD